MSLHALANHLQSAGRGDDKVLIHITPKELNGLNALAAAHGGKLTTNPETGLPEAGFLNSLLPTIIGAGLTIASGGALSPLMAAGITGAGYGIATGSLQKGLMAGLGAYGGAGLVSGLSAAGAAGAQTAGSGASYGSWAASDAGKLATEQAATAAKDFATANTVGTGATNAATNGLNALNPASPFASTPGFNASTYGLPGGGFAPNTMAPPVNASSMMVKPTSVFTGQAPNAIEGASIRQVGLDKSMADSIAAQQKAGISSGTPSYWDNVKGGFKEATGSWDGLKNVWDKTPTGTGASLIGTGMSLMNDMRDKGTGAPEASNSYLRPFDYSIEQNPNAYAPTASTAEREYFVQPRFIARPIEKIAKEGGLMKLAVGGEVENMSAMNSLSGNTMYPQSQVQTPMYSNPMVQRPVQNDVINAGLDTPTQPYSGEMRMASGGAAAVNKSEPTSEKKYSYDPETMKFTETTTTTPAANANFGFPFMGQTMMGGTIGGAGLGNKISNGAYFGVTPALLQMFGGQQQAPQPTTTTEVTGGIAAPYVPQGQVVGAPDTSMVPNTQIQPLRTPEQQLGLEAFYPMMEQQLAMKRAQMQAQGFASGGIARFGGGGAMQYANPEAQARHKYAAEHGPGIIKTVSDDEWNAYKKLNDLSFKSDASAAPTYNYNPQNMQFTDNAGKVTGGVQSQFMPMPLMAPAQPEQALGTPGYQGYAGYAAGGGISTLGGYSDGGRLLKGPGDGVSDSIPASIGDRQPARLADGEFVVPARIVSELGNGSTEAGARKLYQMMERVQHARRKTVGKNQVAKNTKAEKLMPA